MKYALLVYDTSSSWNDLPADDKRALHSPDTYQGFDAGSTRLLAHYRLREPRLTTTVTSIDDEIIRAEGPATEVGEKLRALFIVEGDDGEAVLELAAQLPAVRMGGTVEAWPLIEPDAHGDGSTAAMAKFVH